MHYRWETDHPEPPPSALHGFTAFVPSKVELRGTTLLIGGASSIVLTDAETHNLTVSGKQMQATLEIDLAATDMQAALSHISDLLFFKDAKIARATIPEHLQPDIPATIDSHTGAVSRFKTGLTFIREDGSWRAVPSSDRALKQPAPTKRGKMPQVAELPRHATAISSFAVTIDESGKVSDVWLVHPAGFGVDQAAEHAIRGLLYKPATYNDKPVAVVASDAISVSSD